MKVHIPWKGRQVARWRSDPPIHLPSRGHAKPTSQLHDTFAALLPRDATAHSVAGQGRQEPPRIALYSHDAMGLGHMRRNLLIAQTLANSSLHANVLIIAGAGEATAFGMPAGVDCLTLPALRKEGHGCYRPRNLDLDLDQLLEMRSRTISSALEAFQPSLFIVDKLPRGVLGELDLALTQLKAGGGTVCVLGMRDVLDEPDAVRRDWRKEASEQAILSYYEAIWVYGDPRVYDMTGEYQLPDSIAAKVRYAGYLDQSQRLEEAINIADPLVALGLPAGLNWAAPKKLLLCLVGGGQDGARLAEAFSLASLPDDAVGVIVTGPYMPPDAMERLQRRAAGNPRLGVLRFVPEPAMLMSRADRVVAMGGYNTTCEILSFRKPALLVPRVEPRLEQWIRARRMADLDLLDVIHPADLNPDAISAWLRGPRQEPHHALERIDLNGLSRLPGMAQEAMALIDMQSALSNRPNLDVDYRHAEVSYATR